MSKWGWRLPSVRIAGLEAEVRRLTAERDEARRGLERVVNQRDELRRVIGDLRSYARQEAERAVVDNLARRDAAPDPINYVWRSPDGDGWVDAWNGWYPTYRQALAEAKAGVGRPWVLSHGEGTVDEEEHERRRQLAGAVDRNQAEVRATMRPTVTLAAHLHDPKPVVREDLSACYHPAEDSSMEAFWHRCHGTHEPCSHG